MLDSIAIILITTAISGATTYIVGKTLLKTTKKDIIKQLPDIMDFLKDECEDYLHTEEGAKLIYAVGALIGNGAKQGLGITAKGGKFKWENIFGQIAAGFIEQYFPGNPQQGQPQPLSRSKRTLNIE